MNENFIPYKLTLKLKEKGFEAQGGFQYLYYNGELVKVYDYCNMSPYKYAPTIAQVLKWLREEKNIYISIFIDNDSDCPVTYEIYKDTECVRTHHGKYFSLNDWTACELSAIEYVFDNLI